MEIIGTIKFLQIQQDSLKEHQSDGSRTYNPTPLVQLKAIKINQSGVIGITDTESEIIDVHNTNHPNSRYRGDNSVSIGFTSHYEIMRQTLGNHLTDGIAGENIIVECTTSYTPDSLGKKLAIQIAGNKRLVHLNEVIPIPPCEPFSRFASNRELSPQETKKTLQFLSDGTRGFYMKLEQMSEEIIISSGDMVYRL